MGLIREKVFSEGKQQTVVSGRFSSTPAVVKGVGYTVSSPGTGRYLVTFDNAYDDDIVFVASLQAATPGDLAGHTLIWDTISAKAVEVVVYNDTPAAHDLAASEWINFVAVFKATAV
jgi:hypothetical protein